MLDDIVSTGFTGLYIDRFGYADRAAKLESEVTQAVGAAPFVSENGRLSFYDLRPYRADLEARIGADAVKQRSADLLGGLVVSYGHGFSPPEGDAASHWVWAGPDASLRVVRTSGPDEGVTLTFSAASHAPGTHHLHITTPEESTEVDVSPDPTPVTVHLQAGTDGSEVTFSSDIPAVADADTRDLRFRLEQLAVAPDGQAKGNG
jgi:phosphoglycerol transferase